MHKVDPDPLERFYTPAWVVSLWWKNVYPLLPKIETVLEPSVGQGAWLGHWPMSRTRIVTVDADPDIEAPQKSSRHLNMRFEEFAALLGKPKPSDRFDLAIGNPPFSLLEDHIGFCLNVANSVSFLGRLGFMSSQGRLPLFISNPPTHVHVLPKRPAFPTPADPNKKTTDKYDYGFFTWVHGWKSGPTELHWMELP
jgi:hypothetical protein